VLDVSMIDHETNTLTILDRSRVSCTYRLNILSPIRLDVGSRAAFSPSDSSLSFSFVAERRWLVPLSTFGVRDSGVSAGCICTTGIAVPRLASVSSLLELIVTIWERSALS
jgi:hypothetical protein